MLIEACIATLNEKQIWQLEWDVGDLQWVCHQQDNHFYWTERWTEVEKEIKACVQNYLQTQLKLSEFFFNMS